MANSRTSLWMCPSNYIFIRYGWSIGVDINSVSKTFRSCIKIHSNIGSQLLDILWIWWISTGGCLSAFITIKLSVMCHDLQMDGAYNTFIYGFIQYAYFNTMYGTLSLVQLQAIIYVRSTANKFILHTDTSLTHAMMMWNCMRPADLWLFWVLLKTIFTLPILLWNVSIISGNRGIEHMTRSDISYSHRWPQQPLHNVHPFMSASILPTP